jgi:hypothetical protein
MISFRIPIYQFLQFRCGPRSTDCTRMAHALIMVGIAIDGSDRFLLKTGP